MEMNVGYLKRTLWNKIIFLWTSWYNQSGLLLKCGGYVGVSLGQPCHLDIFMKTPGEKNPTKSQEQKNKTQESYPKNSKYLSILKILKHKCSLESTFYENKVFSRLTFKDFKAQILIRDHFLKSCPKTQGKI